MLSAYAIGIQSEFSATHKSRNHFQWGGRRKLFSCVLGLSILREFKGYKHILDLFASLCYSIGFLL